MPCQTASAMPRYPGIAQNIAFHGLALSWARRKAIAPKMIITIPAINNTQWLLNYALFSPFAEGLGSRILKWIITEKLCN